jgi:hypothetical protein
LLFIEAQVLEDIQGLMLLQDVSSASCRSLLSQLQSKLKTRQFVGLIGSPGFIRGAQFLLIKLLPHQRCVLIERSGLSIPVCFE